MVECLYEGTMDLWNNQSTLIEKKNVKERLHTMACAPITRYQTKTLTIKTAVPTRMPLTTNRSTTNMATTHNMPEAENKTAQATKSKAMTKAKNVTIPQTTPNVTITPRHQFKTATGNATTPCRRTTTKRVITNQEAIAAHPTITTATHTVQTADKDTRTCVAHANTLILQSQTTSGVDPQDY
ncbi:hypothetical protein FRC10_001285 [Ceratobasidium sp. 414]|nr:hypothetical protein FRC10_001285 [Ceratobasidium sp. 414]